MFGKLRKATISFFISLCSSVRLSAGNSLAPNRRIFMKIHVYLFFKNCWENEISLIYGNNKLYFTWISIPFMMIYFSLFLRMRSATVNSCRENQNKYLNSHTIFRKYCRLWDNVVKYFGSGKVRNDNLVKVHFKLETEFYKQSLRICMGTLAVLSLWIRLRRAVVLSSRYCNHCRIFCLSAVFKTEITREEIFV